MVSKEELIDDILEECGFEKTEQMEFLMTYAMDSVVPGICVDDNCRTIVDSCEPDAERNWCPGCGRQTVASVLSLAGF